MFPWINLSGKLRSLLAYSITCVKRRLRKSLFLTVFDPLSKLMISESPKTLLSHSVNVRLEHRESQCIVHGSFVAFSLDTSRCLFDGSRITRASRCPCFYTSPPSGNYNTFSPNGC